MVNRSAWRRSARDKGGEPPLDNLVTSDDPNFRPSGVSVAPDGSLYFMDWHKPLIGHLQHHLRDPNREMDHGRIYRLTYVGMPLLKPAKIAGEPVEKLLELLKEPENNVRERAKIELGTHETPQVIAAVDKWVAALDPKDAAYEHNVLEALWVKQYHNVVDEALIKRVLSSPDAARPRAGDPRHHLSARPHRAAARAHQAAGGGREPARAFGSDPRRQLLPRQ